MYKVFVNDCPIILTDNKKISTGFEEIEFKSVTVLKIVEEFFQNKHKRIYLLCDSVEECWEQFKLKFTIQEAAGGKVLNANNDVLFIYRFHKWDLPKGKIEKGESIAQCAIREVEEECGITDLKIEKELQTTYHIFKHKNKIILKITYWFLMNTNFNGKLKPQEEEAITQVVFKNKAETKKALLNTYENIKLLF
ncbi:NUDIX domain-containing protein [Lutibacter sp.]|uniref:NUDIX hydrolase n=1 Tax=Lutibacter sp. TaxID=1925666 RepID=UPI0025C62874|nr:NUDIX domain-containing protein [Lutibacter sp.]MCF6167902.1 NUDIX domain-containing protein [Lutibacter sp.]